MSASCYTRQRGTGHRDSACFDAEMTDELPCKEKLLGARFAGIVISLLDAHDLSCTAFNPCLLVCCLELFRKQEQREWQSDCDRSWKGRSVMGWQHDSDL